MEQTSNYGPSNLNFDKVWLMFQETDRKFQETKELLANSSLESDRKFQETKELLAKSSLETDRKFQETEAILKKLMTKSSEYDSRWGKFVESLVEGSLVQLLRDRQILVNDTLMRRKKFFNGRDYEIDIIALNGNDVVVVEVKTTLSTNDVSRFLKVLGDFKSVFKEYSEKNVIGTVAFIGADKGADSFAINKGLYVIKATGDSARITNPIDFEPVRW